MTFRPKTKVYRAIWEKHYNACLLPGMHIHHIDGNPRNNDPINLLACTPEEHWEIHFKQGDVVARNGKFVQLAAKFGKANPMFVHGQSGKSHVCVSCGKPRSSYYAPRCNKCKNHGSENSKARPVMCTKTGKRWGCIKDAANDLRINHSTLKAWLNPKNNNPNKSTLRYA